MKERKSSRLKIRALVRAEYEGREYALENLSEIGAFIRTASPLAVGKELELRLVGKRLPEPIELTAIVRHRQTGVGMGVEFTQFQSAGQVRLKVLLASVSVARILVVDDNEETRHVLSVALEQSAYDVVTAEDGMEGLQKALELQPDLIILDLAMPKLSGLEVCQRVRASPELAHVPIIVLTASTEPADFRAAQQRGAVLFVRKPFEVQKLLSHVQMLLHR